MIAWHRNCNINIDTVRADISMGDINIWSVSQENDDGYAVVYSVDQKITKDKNNTWICPAYRIQLHQYDPANVVITQNPSM